MPSVSSSTSQRCSMADSHHPLEARNGLSRHARHSLFEIGLDDVALLDDDFFAGFQAFEHFRVVHVAFAEFERAAAV